MRVHLLGTAAGSAFPQWNCNCRNCGWARTVPGQVVARTQSCIAVSSDYPRWFLVNASPDIRIQLESFPPLWPPSGFLRGTAIAGVLLTNADLDHTQGLFNLRERGPLVVHASGAVRRTIVQGVNIDAVLSSYHGIENGPLARRWVSWKSGQNCAHDPCDARLCSHQQHKSYAFRGFTRAHRRRGSGGQDRLRWHAVLSVKKPVRQPAYEQLISISVVHGRIPPEVTRRPWQLSPFASIPQTHECR